MSPMTEVLFSDRADAARQLAAALAPYRASRPLVLAIPRGGVPMAAQLADALQGDLDVVLVRKLRAPYYPEAAIGAIDEGGIVQLSALAHRAGADRRYVDAEAKRQLATLRQRRARYTPECEPVDPAGRTVIVVDDGLATGATMSVALAAVRRARAARIVCAVPVASAEGLEAVRGLADEVCCLHVPEDFQAVGQYYGDFSQVGDEEVVSLLSSRRHTAMRAAVGAARPVQIVAGDVTLRGDLGVPAAARGLIVFAHGSGSGRGSPRNRQVAEELQRAGFATLLLDLLTEREEAQGDLRFDIALLARRLEGAVAWARREPSLQALPSGLFGASTGAAAALTVAAAPGSRIAAVVSRGGRPDLAGADVLSRVSAPTLLLVGDRDREVVELNRMARAYLRGVSRLTLIAGATHLFEEPGTLHEVATQAAAWFGRYLGAQGATMDAG